MVGAAGVQAGVAPAVREIADRNNIGVLNTWAAKGLFPWNHPAHLGTIGLQAGDFALAGLTGAGACYDDIVLCGVGADELPRALLAGQPWRDVLPVDLAEQRLPVRSEPTARPALYFQLSAVCQPLYADESRPLNPALAASQLAALLPDNGLVSGDCCVSGFWLGRTIPTRVLGSVQLPTRPTPGFAATHAATARRTGRFAVAVVDHIDAATQVVLDRARDLVVEVWCADGDEPSADERAQRLHDAHATGGVHVLRLAIRSGDIDALIAVAGAPLWHP